MKIRKAVIPAAGLGTRFLPATKAQPKEMLPIVDKPTIQYIVEEAAASGIEDIIIITGRTKKAIEDHFDRSIELELALERSQKEELLKTVRNISSLANIYYIRQQEAKGLGHAISCARTFIGNESFAVLLGDDIVDAETPAIAQLMQVHEQTGNSVLGVQPVAKKNVNKYGIILPDDVDSESAYAIRALVEKPSLEDAPSNIAIMGRYVLTPGIFDAIDRIQPGYGGELQLTDALNFLLKSEPIFACEFQGRRYDVGDKMGYLSASLEFALNHYEFADELADYLAKLALDTAYPIHSAIAARLKRNREQK